MSKLRGDGSLGTKPYKSSAKAETPVLVVCGQKDCIFFEGSPEIAPEKCWCSHPSKRKFMVGKCPLYQLDWAKKAGMMNAR